MLDSIKKFFVPLSGDDPAGTSDRKRDVRVATCALVLEMAQIDGAFSGEQCNHIIALLQSEYGLSGGHAEELARAAHAQLRGSMDLWRFASLINENYSPEEKIEVVELLWRVVYADGHLSDHEQYVVTKLRKMLRVPHRDVIDAKLRVLQELKKEGEAS